MIFEHYLLLLLAVIPLIYKYFFWFYVIQLKEYRWDRFSEYISTPQGKSAIINIRSVVELPLFIISLIVFINAPFEIIIYNILFVFLIMQNIFIFRKIIKSKLLKPKITGRLLLLVVILLLILSFELIYIILGGYGISIYSYLLLVMLFPPIFIFLTIGLSLPIVNFLKNKKIKKAIIKSKKINKPIKIGITGSYGKSSVKEFLASILEQSDKTLKTPENINSELGVSNIVINKLSNKYKYFVAEMGAYKIGEIDLLGKIVNHKYGFLTAIGTQHLGLFGSEKNIQIGKSEISNSVLKNNGILYINWDNEKIRQTKFNKKLNIVKYGKYKGSDASFTILKKSKKYTQFEFEYKKQKNVFKLPLIGDHNIINITGVLAFCYDIGIKIKDLQKYIENISTPENTLSIFKIKNTTLINDTYNLSEEGLLSGIQVLSNFKGKKILVMDDILELGSEAEKIHYKIAKKIAKEKIVDKVLYCGLNYKNSFIKGLLKGGFLEKNLITNLSKLEISNEYNNILFEGKKSKEYFNKIK